MIKYFGINKAIFFGSIARIWSASAGAVTMVLIASQLSTIEQGYYYTFASLLALQVFFELGLVTVIAQFVSHEFSQLSWGAKGKILGNVEQRNRVLGLLGRSLKWYFFCSCCLIVILIIVGYLFFRDQAISIDFQWKLPWALAVLGVGINLLIIPFYALISGSGDVASVNFREMLGSIFGSILSWTILFFDGGLYSLSAATIGSTMVGMLYLIKKKPDLIKEAIIYSSNKKIVLNSISWRREVWPMQWKIALSWISGYFIFQLFTPILFKFHGASIAGQMGFTLAAVNAILGLCLLWPTTKMPEFGKLISAEKWGNLDLLFYKTRKQSIYVYCILSVIFILFILAAKEFANFGERFLSIEDIAPLVLSIFIQLIISNWAMYMRAFKQDPMVYLSVIGAILTGISTVVLGFFYSSTGQVYGYLFLGIFFGIPTTYAKFKKFRHAIHH